MAYYNLSPMQSNYSLKNHYNQLHLPSPYLFLHQS
eukprot:bmy_17611T0